MRMIDAHHIGAYRVSVIRTLGITMSSSRGANTKKATNLSIDRDLLEAARDCGINLSAALEETLAERIRAHRAARWLEDNRGAIDRYNERVARDGVFSEGVRGF